MEELDCSFAHAKNTERKGEEKKKGRKEHNVIWEMRFKQIAVVARR